jgi:2'-5' RNA ligase
MFVAIRPSVDFANSLNNFRLTYHNSPQNLQWIDRDDLHVTLRYLGSQAPSVAASITDGLSRICKSPVNVRLDGADMFEDVGVLFVRILPTPDLMKLQKSVDQIAIENSVSPSEHRYRPHISIARLRKESERGPRTPVLSRMLPRLSEFCQQLPCQEFRVSEVTLFESVEGRYSELKTFVL